MRKGRKRGREDICQFEEITVFQVGVSPLCVFSICFEVGKRIFVNSEKQLFLQIGFSSSCGEEKEKQLTSSWDCVSYQQ